MDQNQFEILNKALISIAAPNWGAITTLVIGAINMVLIFFAYRQLKAHAELMRWSKASIQNQKLYEVPNIDIELAVAHVLKTQDIKAYELISESKCAAIYDDPESRIPVVFYLNHFETICVAISAEVVDKELAYNLHAARIIVIWDIWQNLCKLIRTRRGDEEIFWEMEKWAGQFANELKSRAAIEKKHREEVEKRISDGRGMQKV